MGQKKGFEEKAALSWKPTVTRWASFQTDAELTQNSHSARSGLSDPSSHVRCGKPERSISKDIGGEDVTNSAKLSSLPPCLFCS